MDIEELRSLGLYWQARAEELEAQVERLTSRAIDMGDYYWIPADDYEAALQGGQQDG